MMGGYWYLGPAPDGRRFCYAKHATFLCPVSDMAGDARVPDAEPANALVVAAEALGVSVRYLSGRLHSGHRRARVDGKLTDRCECGAKMNRLGFAYWTERPSTSDDAGAQISRAMFGEATERVGATHYADTKREAQTWAREELKIAKEA